MAKPDLAGIRVLSRAISQVEDRADGYQELLREAYARPERATVIGVTGPPGTGKSTLVDALAARWGAGGEPIAVLAIDPSSPFSGGAVLGDRIRMERSHDLSNVFFRSLSARGHVGGLNEATSDLIALLSGFGFKRILLETVGAGQSDIEVTGMADCTLVVAVPGLGDAVQALKAGMMEIGDVYVVNKSDLPGADSARLQIEGMLGVAYVGQVGVGSARPSQPPPPATAGVRALMRRHGDAWSESSVWRPPVIAVAARTGQGVEETCDAIDRFVSWSEQTGRQGRKYAQRIRDQLLRLIARRLLEPFQLEDDADGDAVPASLAPWVEAIVAGSVSPADAADSILSSAAGRTL